MYSPQLLKSIKAWWTSLLKGITSEIGNPNRYITETVEDSWKSGLYGWTVNAHSQFVLLRRVQYRMYPADREFFWCWFEVIAWSICGRTIHRMSYSFRRWWTMSKFYCYTNFVESKNLPDTCNPIFFWIIISSFPNQKTEPKWKLSTLLHF